MNWTWAPNWPGSWDAGATALAPAPWRPGVPDGRPPRRSLKPLIISLVVAGVVAAVVAAVIVVNLPQSVHGTAGAAVKGYLQALARGDAKKALSYSTDKPASTELLTDDILKRQIDKWPITEIQILDDSSAHGGISFAQVHVSAKFGDQTSDVTMSVTLKGRDWKLDHAAIKIDTENAGANINQSLRTVTVFGKPANGTLYVFPGWVDTGSSNPNLSVTAKPMLLDHLATYGGAAFGTEVQVELSDDGNNAIPAAVSNALAQCQKSSSLHPPGCPVEVMDSTLVDGTAVWGPADVTKVKIDMFDEYRMQAMFSGEITIPLSGQVRTGGTKIGTMSAYVAGTADMTQSPPAVTVR